MADEQLKAEKEGLMKKVIFNIDDLEADDLDFMGRFPEIFKEEYERIMRGTKVEKFSDWYKRDGYKMEKNIEGGTI